MIVFLLRQIAGWTPVYAFRVLELKEKFLERIDHWVTSDGL